MANELKDEAEAEPWAYRYRLPCSLALAIRRQEWQAQGDLIGVTAGAQGRQLQLRSTDWVLICQRWARHFQSPEASTGRHSTSPICPHPYPPMLARDTGETVTVNCAKLSTFQLGGTYRNIKQKPTYALTLWLNKPTPKNR